MAFLSIKFTAKTMPEDFILLAPQAGCAFVSSKRFFDKCEKQYLAEILNLPLWEPLPVTQTLLKRLKQNGIICVAGDSTFGWNWVHKKFLGRNRAFSTGMVSLSRITEAPILPVFCTQEAADRIALIVEPSLGVDANMDRDNAAEVCIDQYVSLLESYVRKHPGQYYNWHVTHHAPANPAPAAVAQDVDRAVFESV